LLGNGSVIGIKSVGGGAEDCDIADHTDENIKPSRQRSQYCLNELKKRSEATADRFQQ
jgi:hypothetical protein